MKAIGQTVAVIGLAALSAILSGYVLSILWGWFFVPVFQAPLLNIPSAIGLALIVVYLTHQDNSDLSDDRKEFSDVLLQGCIKATIKPATTLFIGWVVAFWM